MSSPIQRHLKQNRPFPTLEDELFVGIQVVADRIMEPWARYLRCEVGLTHVQYNVLRILRGAGEGGLLCGEIGPRLLARSPDVTRILDRLEKGALVRRAVEPEDRRAVRVRITEEGLDRLRRADRSGRGILRECFQGIEEERLEALREVLGDILERLAASERLATSEAAAQEETPAA